MLFLTLLATALAHRPPAQPEGAHARVRLVSELAAAIPGETAHLGLLFDIDPGWHLYYDGINDSGFAPAVEWKLPDGLEPGKTLWPAPTRYPMPGDLLDHIYEKQLLLIVPLDIPADATPGRTLRIEADVEWLVCSDVCLPGSGRVSLSLPIAAEASPSSHSPTFDRFRARLPQSLPEHDPPVSSRWEGDKLVLNASDAAAMSFYPRRDSRRPVDLLGEGTAKGNSLALRFELPDAEHRDVHGIIEVKDLSGAFRWYDLKIEPSRGSP